MNKKSISTNNGLKGGFLKGKPHYDKNGNSLGGIKAVVTDQGGQPVELEGGEAILRKSAMESDKEFVVKGTPKEIASTLNQEFDGRAIGDSEAEILAKYREGGELIKRADGSYSKRGLYDNIRDNIGSGRKPTKQMLEQEAKIKDKYSLGGKINEYSVNEFEFYLEDKYNANIDLGDYKKYIYLSKISIPKEIRGLGIGSEIMNEIIAYADDNNRLVTLTPSTDYGASSVARLKEFYKNFGFIENKGRNKDFEISQSMYRVPVNEKYHLGGDMTKHLAPNGKPSNLNHEQWHLVRTPEFKAWFGDWENDTENSSKVVDENGEPLVVYHGTPYGGFYEFDLNNIGKSTIPYWGKGIYLTASKFYAKGYAENKRTDSQQIYNLFAKCLNPYIVKRHLIGRDDYMKMIEENQYNDFNDFLIDNNYDSVIILDGESMKDAIEIMTPLSNQIKLADGSNTTFDENNDDIRYKEGGNISNMTPSELKAFYDSPEGRKLDAETYAEWKRLVNMTKSELEKFYNSEEGKEAGLSQEEANRQGIDSGRESARWIMKMKDIPYTEWTSNMWRWAKKQISFIKRMSGMKGELYDDNGNKTRKHTALLIWGHNPEKKFAEGGGIESNFKANFELWVDKLNRNRQLPIEFTTSKSIEGVHKDSGYGDSYYIMIFDENWNQYAKLRFSGHSVSNINRVKDEIHNPNISRFYEIVSRAMSKKQQEENPEELIKFKDGGSIEKNKEMEKEIQPIQKDLFGSENENQITIFDLSSEKFAKGGEISTSSFYAKKEVYNWNEIPSTWKNTNKIAKVNLKLNPSDDKFNSVFQKFLGNDPLSEIVTGFNVDDNGITATNFHILVTVPTTEDLEKGVSLKAKKIEGKYPNYGAVIPKEFASIHKFDCYKLLQYCRVALNYCNKTTNQISVKVDNSLMGFNANFLINTLETSLKLGHENLYFHFSSPSRAALFSTVENPTLGKDIIILVMPVMVNNAYDDKRVFGAMDIDYGLKLACHFDFNKNNIINGDGSVVDFKMYYGENPIFTKQVIEALKENIGKKNSIAILDNFVVENDKAIVVNMVDEGYTLKINNITAPKGIYYVSNDVAVYSTDEKDYSDFPNVIKESPFLNRLTINSDYFKWFLDTLELFKGDDDLRPVMKGLSIVYDSYKLTFASTDAHKLGRIVSNDSVVFENKNSFKVILPFNRIADLLNLSSNEDIVLEINESNLKIVADKFECDNRLIDGKYPNYDAVIPQDSKNKLTLNKEQLLKALKTKEAENFIKKYKKSINILGKKEGDNLLVSLYVVSSKDRDFSIVDSVDILTADLKLDEESYRSTTESCLLLMPVKVDVEHLFSFNLGFFKDLIKPISSNYFDLNYSDESRAYIVNSNDFDYTKAVSKPKAVKSELAKGTEHEMEHLETLKKVAEGKLTPEEAVVQTAKTHIAENPNYYEDLAKMEAENEESIPDLIEGLKVMLEYAKGEEKTELENTIEGLKLLLDDEKFAEGGELNNNSMFFEPSKSEEEEEKRIMENQFGKNI